MPNVKNLKKESKTDVDMNNLPDGTKVKFDSWAEESSDNPKWTKRNVLTIQKKQTEFEPATESDEEVPASYIVVDSKDLTAQIYADELGSIVSLGEEDMLKEKPEEKEKPQEKEKVVKKKTSDTTKEKKTKNKEVAKTKKESEVEIVSKGSILGTVLDKIDSGSIESAIELSENISSNYFVLGGLLSHIYDHDEYTELGYSAEEIKGKKQGFHDFIDERLSVGYRSAMYFKTIYEKFQPLGEEAVQRLSALGWAKAKELARHVNEDNVTKLLGKAEKLKHNDLHDYLQEEFSTGERTSTKLTKIGFGFHQDQGDVVEAAIQAMIERDGLEENQRAEAMLTIVTEWDGMINNNPDFQLEQAIDVVESMFDVKLKMKVKK